MRQARLHDTVAVVAIRLEWATGVDNDVGSDRRQLGGDVAVSIKSDWRKLSSGVASRTHERVGPGNGSAADEQGQSRVVFQQFDDATAKNTITADDQDFQAVGHEMKRSACDGSGR